MIGSSPATSWWAGPEAATARCDGERSATWSTSTAGTSRRSRSPGIERQAPGATSSGGETLERRAEPRAQSKTEPTGRDMSESEGLLAARAMRRAMLGDEYVDAQRDEPN